MFQRLLLLCLAAGAYLISTQTADARLLTIRAIDTEMENGDQDYSVQGQSEQELQNGFITAWIDAILEHARSVMRKRGLNEIRLQPESSNFSRRILGIKFHGEASIVDGVLSGLETIHRTGVINIKPELRKGDILATFELGVDNPSVRARAFAQFMNIGPSGNISGSYDKVRVKTVIRISKSSGLHADLDTFEITDLGKLSMEVKGLGSVMNYIMKHLVEGLGNRVFKRKIKEVMEGTMRKFIEKEVLNNALLRDSVAVSMFNFAGSNNDNNGLQPNSNSNGS